AGLEGIRGLAALIVVGYGLLGQDGCSVGSPNRAFWPIAIEAQLYVLHMPIVIAVSYGLVLGRRGASRASGPRSQAGGRCRPARPRPVAGRARPASRPGPPVPPSPGDSATRSGSC